MLPVILTATNSEIRRTSSDPQILAKSLESSFPEVP